MGGNGVLAVAGESVEVVGTARRRRFTEAFKRRILDEVDRARSGEIGLILRREGLYSSQLADWRRWRSGMTKKRGSRSDVSRAEFERVVKENAQLKLKLRKAEAMLELQKKAAEIVNSMRENSGDDS
jgi:transposase-like protein